MLKRSLWCELFVLLLAGLQVLQLISRCISFLVYFRDEETIAAVSRPSPAHGSPYIRHYNSPMHDEVAEEILMRAWTWEFHNAKTDSAHKKNKVKIVVKESHYQKEEKTLDWNGEGDSVEITSPYKGRTKYLIGAEGLPTREPLNPADVPEPFERHKSDSDFEMELAVKPHDAVHFIDPWNGQKRLGSDRVHWNDPVWFKHDGKVINASVLRVHADRVKFIFTNESGLEDTVYFKPGSTLVHKIPEPVHKPVNIPFVDCEGMSFNKKGSRLSKLKEFILKSGASHFKKAFFWTGLLDNKYPFFAYNYSVNNYGKVWEEIQYRYDTMVTLYNSDLFVQPLMSKIWGFCRERYMIIMEWFPLTNMDRYVKLVRFDDYTMKRYMPVFLLELIQSIIDLNNLKLVMCDWKMDQWMLVDVRGRLKLNDVDNCFHAYEMALGKLTHCNCPYEFAPYRDPKRSEKPFEKWTNRTWGDVHWFKNEPYLYHERVQRGKPSGYKFTCESYNDFLWDYGYPIHEYWFQAARLTEMAWVLMVKPKEVISEVTENKLRRLANRAVDIWNPMKVADYKTEVLKILADAPEFDKEIHEYIVRENKTWSDTYLKKTITNKRY